MPGPVVAADLPLPLTEALRAPPGARWIRTALQVNPFGYSGANAPSNSFSDEESYNTALVAKCLELNIEMIAVTDHWRVDSAQGLIAACDAAGIFALPGFEGYSESGGAHVLVIFSAGTPAADINAAIGACGENVRPGCDARTPGRSFSEIAGAMTKRGALVIAPHVNTPSGLLSSLTGQALSIQWRCEDFQTAALSPGQAVSQLQKDILANREAEFRREHAVAVLHADDICHPDRLAEVGATTWVKMSTPSLGGLRVAVRTPDTRIRTGDPGSVPHARIKAVSWEGGFLDGLRLRVNESLTAFIGGRGTGKSTVIESLRYVLDVPAIGDKAKADHEDFVRKVLRGSTTVSVLIESVTPVRQEFIVQRTVPDLPIVKDTAGTVLAQRPVDLLGRCEIFSQHELAELAEDKAYVAQMLERFAGADPRAEARAAIARSLSQNQKNQLEVTDEFDSLKNRLDELPRLKEQVDQFKAAGVDARLEEQRELQQEERLLHTALKRVDAVAPAKQSLESRSLLDSEFAAAPTRQALPRGELLAEIEQILHRLREGVDAGIRQIDAAVDTAKDEIDALQTSWFAASTATREQHDEVIRSLQSAGLDAPTYLALTRRVEALESEVPRQKQLERTLEELQTERRQLLAQSQELQTAAYRRLADACTKANDQLNRDVVVRPMRSRDRRHLENLIKEHVPGQRTQIMAALNTDDFAPQAFVAACRQGASTLAERTGIRGAQAAALVCCGRETFHADRGADNCTGRGSAT